MAVFGHKGAGGHSSTASHCGHHGWFAPCSRCWGTPVGPKGWDHAALPLLAATSGAHQAQMVASPGLGGLSWQQLPLPLPLVATKAGLAKPAGPGGL